MTTDHWCWQCDACFAYPYRECPSCGLVLRRDMPPIPGKCASCARPVLTPARVVRALRQVQERGDCQMGLERVIATLQSSLAGFCGCGDKAKRRAA